MALKGSTNEEKTYNYLYEKIDNPFGVCGLMGNLQAESGILFAICEYLCIQRLKEAGKNYTQDSYTKAVDSGEISKEEFLNPLPGKQYGYGVAQWTSPGRKSGLYELAKSRKVSIGDAQVQLDWLVSELKTSYASVWSALKNATSVKEASDIVLTKFEIPADVSTAVKHTRATYGETIYNKYAKKNSSTTVTAASSTISKYVDSIGVHYISNSGSDENGGYSGGKAGDQTGNEWCLRSLYSRPWSCVLRYEKDKRVGMKMAELSILAALNDYIGYDQSQRYDYYKQLALVNFDPSKIKVACEADCSSGVIANAKATGHLLGITELTKIWASTTYDMRQSFREAGYTVLTDSKYLNSADYLEPGDILLNDSCHTAVNVTRGKKVSGTTSSTVSTSSGTTAAVTSSQSNKKGYADKQSASLIGDYICTAEDNLNCRSGAGTQYPIIAALPYSQSGKTPVVAHCYGGYYSVVDGKKWLYVQFTLNGTVYTGFCHEDWLQKVK